MMSKKWIDSYQISKYSTGIYVLTINTAEKWIDYHRYNNEMYAVGEDLENDYELLELEEFIPIEKGKTYICTDVQNKDQIQFYWIPFTHDILKSRQLVNVNRISKDES